MPESWRVRVVPPRTVLGGVEYPHDLDTAPPSDEPELELDLHAVLGGIEIKQEAPEPVTADA